MVVGTICPASLVAMIGFGAQGTKTLNVPRKYQQIWY
jgi:hypothetical protein